MSKELDDAYFRSNQCTYYEPLLSKLVDCVDLLEERIKGLLGANVYVGDTDTLPAGSEATVSASKHGYDTMLEFGIPRGKDGSDAEATDVRIAGKSITADGVADIPIASNTTNGLSKAGSGLGSTSDGSFFVADPSNLYIDQRAANVAITPSRLDYAVKAAMCDGKGAAWTAVEQDAAQDRIGVKKRLENLEAAANGVLYREDVDTTEAYSKDVPAGAMPWASLDKVGGKTVVWNQLARIAPTISPTYPKLELWANTYKIDGNSVAATRERDTDKSERLLIRYNKLFAHHKYLAIATIASVPDGMTLKSVSFYIMNGGWSQSGSARVNTTSPGTYCCIFDNSGSNGTEVDRAMFIVDADYNTNVQIGMITVFESPQLFDLTAMFGSGNEPTSLDDQRIAFIKAYAEEHTEYNPGELMSAEVVEVESKGKNLQIVDAFTIPEEVREMCPGYGWSAGTVCNEIDFERKVYVQRVASVDLGTLDWNPAWTNAWYTDDITNAKPGYYGDKSFNGITEKYEIGNPLNGTNGLFNCWSSEQEIGQALIRFAVCNGSTNEKPTGLLYYELAEPVEIDLSDVLSDDNFIEVEAGGTVTFKQASTQLPVPSSVTYQISTKEAIANA